MEINNLPYEPLELALLVIQRECMHQLDAVHFSKGAQAYSLNDPFVA